jgi:uncharacterized protein YcbX
MMGEELNAAELTERGLFGDRQFALVDRETGKIVTAKNPRRWGSFFDFQATFVEPPRAGSALPAVRITLPDGTVTTSDDAEVAETLGRALGREVTLERLAEGGDEAASGRRALQAEEYWPDLEGLEFRDTVTDFDLPEGTFFDAAPVHLVTDATLEGLRAAYPQGRFEARRFRPNIVIAAGDDGFVEDGWLGRTVAIGDAVRLRITVSCPRCVQTTLAQGDLPKDSGILRAAAQVNATNVGVYATVERPGVIACGDPVSVLA